MSEKMSDDEERSRYFQEIARTFLARRGAPFFLSAKDLDVVSSWEQAGIPLPVVVEGIEKAFENYRSGAGKKSRVLAISFCGAQVTRAFERSRDRKVGGRRTALERRDKRAFVRAEVEEFLKRIPSSLDFLKDIYLEAQKIMADPDMADEILERLDGEVENLLMIQAPASDRATMEKEILAEHKRLSREEVAAAAKIKLLKHLRDKYKVPYLSPFYY